jgi:hypothetical protein
MIIHHVLVRCDKCNWNHEQIAVLDERGEDINVYEKLADVRRELQSEPRYCGCGHKLYATVSNTVANNPA